MNGSIRVMIVDDHEVVRDGLTAVLAGESDLVLVASASSGLEALNMFTAQRPDVVLLDIAMPEMGGLETLSNLLTMDPRARVLMLSSQSGDASIFKAISAGAVGYVLKSSPIEELLSAIRSARSGNVRPGPAVAEQLAKRVFFEDLSDREVQVLERVAEGLSNKEVAAELGISAGTVKVHVAHILTKLRAADRTHAVSIAINRGIVSIDPFRGGKPPR